MIIGGALGHQPGSRIDEFDAQRVKQITDLPDPPMNKALMAGKTHHALGNSPHVHASARNMVLLRPCS